VAIVRPCRNPTQVRYPSPSREGAPEGGGLAPPVAVVGRAVLWPGIGFRGSVRGIAMFESWTTTEW
jgi:hypothetical protein